MDNTSLFILFGLTKDETASNSLLILDVRDVNNLAFADIYPFDQIGSNSTSPSNNSDSIDSSSGSSTGTVAGIAVGCSIVVIYYPFSNQNNNNSQQFRVFSLL